MTPNVYLVVLFFLFSFNAKQLLPCLLYFFKILANGIVYFRACRRGIYTDLYLCMYVCVCVYVCVYVKYARNSFTFYGAVRSCKKRRKERSDIDVSLPFRDRSDFYDRSRVVLSREIYRKHRIVPEI